MIMDKHRSLRPNNSNTNTQNNVISELSGPEARDFLTEMREKINIREIEVEELSELLKAANVTINKLNDRVSSLEEQLKHLQENLSQKETTARNSHELSLCHHSKLC